MWRIPAPLSSLSAVAASLFLCRGATASALGRVAAPLQPCLRAVLRGGAGGRSNRPHAPPFRQHGSVGRGCDHGRRRGVDKAACNWFAAGFCKYAKACAARGAPCCDSERMLDLEDAWVGGRQPPMAAGTGTVPAAKAPLPNDGDPVAVECLLVLDIEGGSRDVPGEDEIIELPVAIVNLITRAEEARFHRFVRPSSWDRLLGSEEASRSRFPLSACVRACDCERPSVDVRAHVHGRMRACACMWGNNSARHAPQFRLDTTRSSGMRIHTRHTRTAAPTNPSQCGV